jgi:hypothetical protein
MTGFRPIIHDFVPLGPSVPEPFPESHAFLDGVASVQETAPASYPAPTMPMLGRMLNNKVESYFSGPYTDVYYRMWNYSSNYVSPGLANSYYLPQALEECLASTCRIALSKYGFYYGILAPEVTKQGGESSGHVLPAGSEAIITTTQSRLKVREWVAYTLLSLILLSAISTIWLIQQRHAHPTPLAEEPLGLLSYACLLHQPGLGGGSNTAHRPCEKCGHVVAKDLTNGDHNTSVISTMLQESNALAAANAAELASAPRTLTGGLFDFGRRIIGKEMTTITATATPQTLSTEPSKVARKHWTIDSAHFYLGSVPTSGGSGEEGDVDQGTGAGKVRVLMAKNLHRKEEV